MGGTFFKGEKHERKERNHKPIFREGNPTRDT